MSTLEGQIAIVTGASRGIGAAIATRLSEKGAKVVCVATSLENAQKTSEAIIHLGGVAAGQACDVSDSHQVDELFKQVEADWGPVSILVNNAGITRDGLLMRMKDEDWGKVVDVNLTSCFYTIRAASKGMMKSRYGRIVNIASVIGLHGAAGQANYSASKAGIVGLTLSVAKELGSRGITCNAVAPGFIETDMTADLPVEMRDHIAKNAPVGRLGTPQDIAPVVEFLVSKESGYITGQVVTVDGGFFL